jgi:heme/copper-type cytochrome/quinol oxidase subunit 3
MSMFGAFFVGTAVAAFVPHRHSSPSRPQELMRPIGLVNTAVLLLSSYLVVSALWAQRSGGMRRATLSLVAHLPAGWSSGC